MKIKPDMVRGEFDNSGGILSPTLGILSSMSSHLDRKNGIQPGMWWRRKGKEMEFLPEEWEGVVVSYVPFKFAFSTNGDLLKKGEPPFCSSVLEGTSLRWDPNEEKYVQGPLCAGDIEAGVPPCPFYDAGSNTKICKKGMLVYIAFKDGTYSRMHLKHSFDVDNLLRVTDTEEEYQPIKFGYIQKGLYFNPTFEAAKNTKDFSSLDWEAIEAKIDAEIQATVVSQRGE